MHLADHIRPLLRDHDCVIIPDFGGLVADISPARAQPGRQALSPPTKLVAFNQALTRNDGLLVDALSQHLGLPIAEARERVRAAVAGLQQELDDSNRTELPGIGIFRRAAGRGLSFEYTGTDNLLAASFGLPELAARPVRAGDSRKLPQPVLRGARTRLSRFVPASVIAVAVSLLLLANYQVALKAGYLPTAMRTSVPKWEWAQRHAETAVVVTEPQQAALGQHDFGSANSEAAEGLTPITEAPAAVPEMAATNDSTGTPVRKVPVVRAETGTTPAPVATPAPAAAPVIAPTATVTAAPKVAPVPAKAAAPVPVAVAVVAAPRKAITASSTIKTPTGRFHVIAGAYTSLARAEQGRRNLLRAGHPARIILPHFGTRYFRLTAGDYADQATAQREAQRLRVSTRCDYITLKY